MKFTLKRTARQRVRHPGSWSGQLIWLLVCLLGAASGSTAAPANDNFANATVLSGALISAPVIGSVNGATLEPGEPPASNPFLTGGSIWYAWTAPVTGKAVAIDSGEIFDEVELFAGSALNSLVLMANRSDDPFSDKIFVWSATIGISYRVRVYNSRTTFREPVRLQLRVDPPPPNDNFAGATLLTGTNPVINGTIAGANREAGEPGTLENTVWYRWTAPVAGKVTADVGTTELEAYTGTTLGTLLAMTNVDEQPVANRRVWRADAGKL